MDEKRMKTELSGCEKVAILLLALSKSSAASVMSAMSEEEVIDVARAMSRLGYIGSDQAEIVLNEFLKEIDDLRKSVAGNVDSTTNILGVFLTQEQLQSMLGKIGSSIWSTLDSVDSNSFAKYLTKEHPQTAAFILSRLPPDYMGKVIAQLDEGIASELVGRIAKLGPISKEVELQVEKCLKVDLLGGIARPPLNKEAAKQFAKMLRGVSSSEREKYIHLLLEKNVAFCEAVQEMMLTLEDLSSLSPAEFGLLLAEVDQSMLSLALRGASPQVQESFFANMPKSMSQIIKQDWEMVKKVKAKETRTAERAIVQIANRLISEGKLSLNSAD
jgi:flagellar motor switch protein FliG